MSVQTPLSRAWQLRWARPTAANLLGAALVGVVLGEILFRVLSALLCC